MELAYKNPGFKYSIGSIMMFQNDKQSEWWRESLFTFYPQLDRSRFDSLQMPEQQEYLSDILQDIYKNENPSLNDKIIKYNDHWELYKTQIEDAFSEAFQLDCRENFNNIIGNITLNPISPRFLDTNTFDVFYKNSERGALGIALHEIVHFIWFNVWQRYFHDDAGEYETPHLKWVFSEMVVDPIMRKDSRLSGINPYFDDGCVYEYFYDMIIDGTPILETLYTIYKNSNIVGLMEQGYAYCMKHEAEIKAHMK